MEQARPDRRLVAALAALLVTGNLLSDYGPPGAGVGPRIFWVVVDMLLLRAALRGSRVGWLLLAVPAALGAILLLLSNTPGRDPQRFAQGFVLAAGVAGLLALRRRLDGPLQTDPAEELPGAHPRQADEPAAKPTA